MRLINALSALSGAFALAALAAAHHLAAPDAAQGVVLAGIVELAAACAGLAIANRAGRFNMIAGALILAGATLFAGEIYVHAFLNNAAFEPLAPVGGAISIAGWILLAFAAPRA